MPEEDHDRPTFRGEDWSLRAWLVRLRDLYLTLDRRTLGLARITIGALLVADLVHRRAAWDEMFSTIGVLPTHVSLAKPQAQGVFSIFHAFSTPAELHVLWWVMLANAACLLIGYRTKVAQILALVFVTGRVAVDVRSPLHQALGRAALYPHGGGIRQRGHRDGVLRSTPGLPGRRRGSDGGQPSGAQ